MTNFLVIGCGNIGALYDFENDKVQTHVKAISQDKNFELTIFDPNSELMSLVAEKYKCLKIEEIKAETLKKFHCVSICGPTETHLEYLLDCFLNNVKLIICEKPITNIFTDIAVLKNAYLHSSSKVIVNYFRKYQPSFIKLKSIINDLFKTEPLLNINVRYQKGFLNNCSHAFDLLEFLFEKKLVIEITGKINVNYDYFPTDPTISFIANWGDSNLNVIGLSSLKYSIFEIDLFFENYRIQIDQSGNRIQIFESKLFKTHQSLALLNEHIYNNCIENNMKNVIDYANKILNKEIDNDNFIDSLNLNEKMLQILKQI
jgi:predicted dehydrogenase